MTIKVIIDDQEQEFNGRLEAMIRYLVKRAEQIKSMPKGSVEYHFGEQSLTSSMHDFEDSDLADYFS